MKIKKLLVGCFVAALFVTFATDGANGPLRISALNQNQPETHAPSLTAKITLPDGASRTVKIDGLGCTATLCSKVFIRAKNTGKPAITLWIDGIAAITDIAQDSALFVMKDGTQQRLSFIPDFRVLYIDDQNTGTQKLDLSKIRSLMVIAPAK